jgi:hypothetical protein
VTIFNGLCYDPNDKFTVPFNKTMLSDEYTGVTEGFQLLLAEKGVKRTRD